jgi:hypothetical protein
VALKQMLNGDPQRALQHDFSLPDAVADAVRRHIGTVRGDLRRYEPEDGMAFGSISLISR